jgi:RHS repeat-associated protein
MSRSASAESRGDSVYLGKDVLGSVRSATGEYGTLEDRYEYDAFGTPYKGDLTSGMNLGYTGKPYDTVTGLYNYGYRDYRPEAARFTTVDPVRDGANWFAYVNNDPVNYIDLWGLIPYSWPMDSGRITTVFGPTKPAETSQGLSSDNHIGIDIAPTTPGTTGQDINSIAAGIVVRTTTSTTGHGNNVIIVHPDGKTSRYAHLDTINVKPGQQVERGDKLGTLGNTGKSSGAHLHLDITGPAGNYVDPLSLLPERPKTITVEEAFVEEDTKTGKLKNK